MKVYKCPNCKAPIVHSEPVCKSCGIKLKWNTKTQSTPPEKFQQLIECENCGEKNPPDAEFCKNCSNRLIKTKKAREQSEIEPTKIKSTKQKHKFPRNALLVVAILFIIYALLSLTTSKEEKDVEQLTRQIIIFVLASIFIGLWFLAKWKPLIASITALFLFVTLVFALLFVLGSISIVILIFVLVFIAMGYSLAKKEYLSTGVLVMTIILSFFIGIFTYFLYGMVIGMLVNAVIEAYWYERYWKLESQEG